MTTKAKTNNVKASKKEKIGKSKDIINIKAPEVELTEKIIPKDTWSEFKKYWNACEWKDLTNADIEKNLANGKYLFVDIPANVTDEKIGKAWFDQMKTFAENGKTGLKYRLNFSNDESSIRDILGLEDLKISDAMTKFREYIGKHIVPLP
jgi:hypothetical protein